jgi:hypothetical protein
MSELDKLFKDAKDKGLLGSMKVVKGGDTFLKELRLTSIIGRNYLYDSDEYLQAHLSTWIKGSRN